ncbi:hypothetical protein [Aureivirga sp. CE67]|uniref:hypothetical protein n=1 Tax=Aureivirga sp. CE67 TaxID=1788983 RepID=UPI0018C91285|nr:hypothetical protein [Aureivirga sp. CE67]
MKVKETNEMLAEIKQLIENNEIRKITEELESTTKKIEADEIEAITKIQSTFDRIHDKVFAFNNILIVAFLGLSKYPSDKLIFQLWVSILPIFNLIFLMILEKWQMERYRLESIKSKWSDSDFIKHNKMIRSQNIKSLLSIIITFSLFIYLVVKILIY